MKKFKKVLAVALSLMMMLGAVAVGAEAANSSGPIYTALVLDTSSSMEGTPLAKQKEAAIEFCDTLLNASDSNYISLITFSSSATLRLDFTNNMSSLKDTINGLSSGGKTNTNEALTMAGSRLDSVSSSDLNTRKIIVLCSDGLPETGTQVTSGKYTSSDSSYYAYANAAYNTAMTLKQSYEIYTLGFFHKLSGNSLTFGQTFMNDLQNDGYYNVQDPETLVDTFEDIANVIVDDNTSINQVIEMILDYLKKSFNMVLSLVLSALTTLNKSLG